VADEGVHQSHGGVIPDLDLSIPRAGDDDRALDVVVVADAGDPVGVSVLVNGELADTVDVPDLEGLVDGAGGNLPVVGRESDGEDVLRVADESLASLGGLEVPKTDGAVPGGRKAEAAVLRDIDVRDEMGVSSHDSLGLASLLLLIGIGDLSKVT
jgi:hypothetical protein